MLPRSSASSSQVYGIVVGGHDGDPAGDESGNLRVYFPGIHGRDVDVQHLNFSPRLMSPTKSTQQEFPGGLDPGTLVVAMKDTGSNYCQIIGVANDTNLSENQIAGNTDLLQFVRMFLSTNINVRIPPTIQETMVGGVRVRKAVEKGRLHNHNLLQGLPTHGALYPMSGSVLPRVSGVNTAQTGFDSLMSGDILGAIPGVFMTLGKMFSILQSTGALRNLKVSREVGLALGSISLLIQQVETMEKAGFNVGGRVDQDTYLSNATQLFSQAQTVSDITRSLSRLQNDPTLFGHDKLRNGIKSQQTHYGPSKISISPTGSIMRYLPPQTRQAIRAGFQILSLINSVYPGQKIFGDSAAKIYRMINRLTPISLAFLLFNLAKQNVGPQAIRHGTINTITNTGGNPFLIP
jgi:hypothetical protein